MTVAVVFVVEELEEFLGKGTCVSELAEDEVRESASQFELRLRKCFLFALVLGLWYSSGFDTSGGILATVTHGIHQLPNFAASGDESDFGSAAAATPIVVGEGDEDDDDEVECKSFNLCCASRILAAWDKFVLCKVP